MSLFDPKPLLSRDTEKPFPLKAPRITSHKSNNRVALLIHLSDPTVANATSMSSAIPVFERKR